MGCVWFFHFTFRKAEHIVPKAYRIRRIYRAEGISCAEGTKNCIRNTVFSFELSQNRPSRLREGLGWAVSAFAKDFPPKQNQGRNLIKM